MQKFIFINHKSKKVESGKDSNFPSKSKGCLWLFLSNPSEEEKNKISKDFEIPFNYLKDYSKEPRSKRYSTTPLIFVMVDYFVANESIKKTNILIIIKKDVLITVFPNEFQQFNTIFDEIYEYMNEKDAKSRNVGEIIYEFLDRDVQDNYDVLRRVEERIHELERKILMSKDNVSVQLGEALDLKRELFAMSRRFWATSKIVFLLKKGLLTVDISEKTTKLLDDTYDTFQHQIEILETQREMLSDVFTLHQTSVSNKLAGISNDLNIIMKKLTSLTVIVLLPSLIASIYGMNFEYLPIATSKYGFWEVILLMALSAGFMYYAFHRKEWI